MPHKRQGRQVRRKSAALRLVETSTMANEPFFDDVDNQILSLSRNTIEEIMTIIRQRYDSAKQQTKDIAEKMNKWNMQYESEWQENPDDEKMFLPKTREQVDIVYAYIMLLVSQLEPMVTAEAVFSSASGSRSNTENEQAKLKEILLDHQFNDIWNFKSDVLPRWLKTFLKYSMGIFKVTYHEDEAKPDLKIDVVDRAYVYFDKVADIKDSPWVIEKYYLTKAEIEERLHDSGWKLRPDSQQILQTGAALINDETFKRYYGKNFSQGTHVKEDELIEIYEYWQAPINGLDDVYAVIIGGSGDFDGTLVRYGRNPFPVKQIPYVGKSFNLNEYQADGKGMVEMYTPFQEIANTFLNFRIDDVKKNIQGAWVIPEQFIDNTTVQDFKDGKTFIRLAKAAQESILQQGRKVSDFIAPLPSGAESTRELISQDLPYLLQLGQESTQISDVFAGRGTQRQTTLGEIQETLTRNHGVYRPVYVQVMRAIEELGDIVLAYYKTEQFMSTNRIVRIVGRNRYAEAVQNWHSPPGSNVHLRDISPDEMLTDVTLNAVNGADALASRTMMLSSIEQLFRAVGQIPDLFNELRDELDFSRMVEIILYSSGHDVDTLRLSDEEKNAKSQQKEQQRQQSIQEQLAIQQKMEGMKAQIEMVKTEQKVALESQAKVLLEQMKAEFAEMNQAQRILLEQEKELDVNEAKILEQSGANLVEMEREAELEKQNAGVNVGHGGNVNQ